jgi:hypothetical protein
LEGRVPDLQPHAADAVRRSAMRTPPGAANVRPRGRLRVATQPSLCDCMPKGFGKARVQSIRARSPKLDASDLGAP